jgi:hypothetical protein
MRRAAATKNQEVQMGRRKRVPDSISESSADIQSRQTATKWPLECSYR